MSITLAEPDVPVGVDTNAELIAALERIASVGPTPRQYLDGEVYDEATYLREAVSIARRALNTYRGEPVR